VNNGSRIDSRHMLFCSSALGTPDKLPITPWYSLSWAIDSYFLLLCISQTRYWTLSYTNAIQFTSWRSRLARSFLIAFCHLYLDLPSGVFLSIFQIKFFSISLFIYLCYMYFSSNWTTNYMKQSSSWKDDGRWAG
jgi:hypothetical protein